MADERDAAQPDSAESSGGCEQCTEPTWAKGRKTGWQSELVLGHNPRLQRRPKGVWTDLRWPLLFFKGSAVDPDRVGCKQVHDGKRRPQWLPKPWGYHAFPAKNTEDAWKQLFAYCIHHMHETLSEHLGLSDDCLVEDSEWQFAMRFLSPAVDAAVAAVGFLGGDVHLDLSSKKAKCLLRRFWPEDEMPGVRESLIAKAGKPGNLQKFGSNRRPAVSATAYEETKCYYFGSGRCQIGPDRFTLSSGHAIAVEILIEVGTARDNELRYKGISNPSRTFKEICEGYCGRLAPFIRRPGGKKGAGYSVSIQWDRD